MHDHAYFMKEAIEEAERGLKTGGIPIGSVLVIEGTIVGRGHNQRIQKGDPILHAEMDCISNAGRLTTFDYSKATIYSTLSPCDMCSGTILLYKIPNLVIGESQTFQGPESYVAQQGVNVINLNDQHCIAMMRDFIKNNPALWSEDIGV